MPLHSRTIGLRALQPNDYGRLYEILSTVHTFRNLGRTIPPDSFPAFIWEGVFSQQIIHFRDHPEGCLGLISIINADMANSVGYFSILIDSEAAPDTAGGEALVLFLRHIFTTTPFRKIYAETSERSIPWAKDKASPVTAMRLEGVLRGHLAVGPTFEDVYMYAFWRNEFLRETEHLAQAMAVDRTAIPRGPRPMVDWATFLHDLQDRFDFLPYIIRSDGGGLRLDELHIDSFLLLEIIVWMEEHYGLTVDDEKIVHVENLQQLYALME